MKLSRFCHIYKFKDHWTFYHALNFNKVRCGIEEAGLIATGNFELLMNDSGKAAIINKLKAQKLLIESSQEDDHAIEAAKSLIRKPYITTAYFFITNHCNLACKYCFEKQSVPGFFHKEKMTKEIALQGLTFFSRLMNKQPERFHEKKTIIFYGGEPLMNREVLRYTIAKAGEYIAEGLFPGNTKIIVVTNGTLLDNEDIAFFLKHQVTLTFSVDGDEAATSNRVFPDGQPAFDKIVSSYQSCRDAGLDLNIACTLTPETIARMHESVRFFIEGMKIKNIGFNVLLDNGLVDIPAGYDEEAADFIVAAAGLLNDNHISENRTGRRKQVFSKKQPCIFDCNAQGGRQIAIAPGGEVGICHEHIADREHFVSNVFEDFDPASDPVFLEWNRRSPLYMEKCHDCRALGICGGGCVINTERLNKSIWVPDARFCTQTLKILDSMIFV